MEGLLAISQRTGTVLDNNGKLFLRLSIAGKSLGSSQKELLTLTEAVANLGRVSGSTREDILNSSRQLAQGLSSNIFRAEEFNSVIEQMPAVIQAVAGEMGKTTAEVQALVREGKLLSKDVFVALLKSSKKAADQASRLPLTFAESYNTLKNSVMLATGEIDKQLRITGTLGAVIRTLSGSITGYTKILKEGSKDGVQDLTKVRDVVESIMATFIVFGGVLKGFSDTMSNIIKATYLGWSEIFELLKKVPGLIPELEIPDNQKLVATYETLNKSVTASIGNFERAKSVLDDFNESGNNDPDLFGAIVEQAAQAERAMKAATVKRDEFFKANQKGIEIGIREDLLEESFRGAGLADNLVDTLDGQFTDALKLIRSFRADAKEAFTDEDTTREFSDQLKDTMDGAVTKYELGTNRIQALIDSLNTESLKDLNLGTQIEEDLAKIDLLFLQKDLPADIKKALEASRIELEKAAKDLANKPLQEMLDSLDTDALDKLNLGKELSESLANIDLTLLKENLPVELRKALEASKQELQKASFDLGNPIIAGINESIEELGGQIGDNLAAKMFGKENSFSDIAKDWAEGVLGDILEQVLFNPLTKDIKAAFDRLFDASGATQGPVSALSSSGAAPGSGGGLFQGLGGLLQDFLPGFANGGTIGGGTAAIVGEKGPELFIPKKSGEILTNRDTNRVMSSNTSNQQVTFNITTPNPQAFQAARGRIEGQMKSALRNS